ncbi:MAG: nicotinate phosphoribosyltransferase [Bryobacter sp.]|nr:nicotinate phosphoribosyltransferase [Bryobacter sp. CoA8 C33]
MRALFTDLYQLTMAAGYWMAGKSADVATFELFVRRLPPRRDYLLVCGLEQAIEYLSTLRFTGRDIDYLRQLPQFDLVPDEFWVYLSNFRFTGDLWAAPEGSVLFAGEPLLTLRAPIIEAQIPETYLLGMIGFQTLIASKASRLLRAAAGRDVVEFGCRRAHAPEAGCLAGRAAYIAGCAGTSNVEAGRRFAVPVFGTAAHSWVLSFEHEQDAFAQLQQLLGPRTVQLIDTYDTLAGARLAAHLGPPLMGVRLDSGDLLTLSRDVRRILDDAGLSSARIMATNDLDEDSIAALVAAGAPIDIFGVGTSLATSFDAPALSAVYKMVEIQSGSSHRFASKRSEGKQTLPGAKQIYRFPDHDLLALQAEPPPPGAEKLLHPVIAGGEVLVDGKNLQHMRDYARDQIRRYGHPHRRVELSESLARLAHPTQP